MTGFKPGDPVHVEADGTVKRVASDGHWLLVDFGDADGAVLSPKYCTPVRPPLRVGDVLTADDPEPPEGTILQDTDGTAFQRHSRGRWYLAGSELPWEWSDLNKRLKPGWSFTVLYVPEDAS